MTENIVSEKMKRSVYLDYPDYRDTPFSTSKKFGVYIPKLNDQVHELIDKHEQKRQQQARSIAQNSRNNHNIFNTSYNQGNEYSTPHNQDNIFNNSIRSNGCNQCNPAVSQADNSQYDQGQPTTNLCACCNNSAHCCCRNKFRIRRNNSRCDSAYSRDTNTCKTQLHGNSFGYYQNRPYSQIGSDFVGSRYYKDHPEHLNPNAPALGKSEFNSQRSRHFENRLLSDARTGQRIGQRSINPVMNNLLKESPKFRKNPVIQDGIMKLKETGCLNLPNERIKRNKATMEKGYIHNDYHTKQSKNGYGRTQGGRSLV